MVQFGQSMLDPVSLTDHAAAHLPGVSVDLYLQFPNIDFTTDPIVLARPCVPYPGKRG